MEFAGERLVAACDSLQLCFRASELALEDQHMELRLIALHKRIRELRAAASLLKGRWVLCANAQDRQSAP